MRQRAGGLWGPACPGPGLSGALWKLRTTFLRTVRLTGDSQWVRSLAAGPLP